MLNLFGFLLLGFGLLYILYYLNNKYGLERRLHDQTRNYYKDKGIKIPESVKGHMFWVKNNRVKLYLYIFDTCIDSKEPGVIFRKEKKNCLIIDEINNYDKNSYSEFDAISKTAYMREVRISNKFL